MTTETTLTTEARNAIAAVSVHGVRFAPYPGDDSAYYMSAIETEAGWDSWIALRARLKAEPELMADFLAIVHGEHSVA